MLKLKEVKSAPRTLNSLLPEGISFHESSGDCFLSNHSRLKGEIGEFHYKRVRHLQYRIWCLKNSLILAVDRFGKFVEIQFDQRRRISRATIRTYFPERSCVCQVPSPEKLSSLLHAL